MKKLTFEISFLDYKINAFMSRVIIVKNRCSVEIKQNYLGVEKNPCVRNMVKRATYGTWCKFSPQLVLAF